MISFAVDGIHPHDVAEILGRQGVCVRAGHHCAQPLMQRLGVSATTRASFGVHNTEEDVDALLAALAEANGSSPDGRPLPRGDPRPLQAPHNWGPMDDPDLEFSDTNPLCGDELKVMLRVGDDNTVQEVRFDGHGCAISQAAASMASEEIKGMKVDDLVRLDRSFVLDLLGIDISATG